MATQLFVVGGGFAGLWATAAACARHREAGHDALDVALVTAGPDLTIRPRLYEADVQATLVPLAPIVAGLGARLQVATVTGIDPEQRTITAGGKELTYDALVVAVGSTTPTPPIPGLAEHGHRIDTAEHAMQFRAAIGRRTGPLRVTVVGGGLTGIELATELASEADLAVTLVDAGRIGGGFGPDGEAVVRDALSQLGVQTVDGSRLEAVQRWSAITDHGMIDHDILVWCGGLRASPLTELVGGTRDPLGRLEVDRELRVAGVTSVWAAGDVARTLPDGAHVAPMSCQFAIPSGQIAGHNAAAYLLGGEGKPFAVDRYVTCVDLGAAGALFTTGWERTLSKTGAAGKAVKRRINRIDIYPPSDPEAFSPPWHSTPRRRGPEPLAAPHARTRARSRSQLVLPRHVPGVGCPPSTKVLGQK